MPFNVTLPAAAERIASPATALTIPTPVMLPEEMVRFRSPVRAVTLPASVRSPPAVTVTFVAPTPLAAPWARIVRSSFSLTVSAPAETFAKRLVTLVPRLDAEPATRLSTLPVNWLAAERVTAPLALMATFVADVTLPVPLTDPFRTRMLMSPTSEVTLSLSVRLPEVSVSETLSATTPFATTPFATTSRPLASTTVSVPSVTFAARPATLVLTAEVFWAVRIRLPVAVT